MKFPTVNADAVIAIWDRVRTSLWFVPGLMVAGAFGLAVVTPVIDGLMPKEWASRSILVFSGRPAGARAVLGTIATSTIGVAGVVFSMTIVSLQLASSQFGPRLLRTFLRDRSTQLVLGTFLGTYLYCVLMMPTIDGGEESVFVPHVAVTIAVILAITSLAMLVYYIDHVAQSIHADAVMHSVGRDLESVIDELFPEEVGDGAAAENRRGIETEGEPVRHLAEGSGYLRFVNGDRLVAMAEERGLFVRVRLRPGEFATRGECLAEVWGDGAGAQAVREGVRESFVLSAHRTTLQDVLFTFEQLSEIAVRAMSPGVNDPTTAVHSIDRIGSGLARLVTRELPSRWREDSAGVVRVRIDPVGLGEVLESTVVAISRAAGVYLPVWVRLVEVLEMTAGRARRPDDVGTVRSFAARLVERGESELASGADRERLRAAAGWVLDE